MKIKQLNSSKKEIISLDAVKSELRNISSEPRDSMNDHDFCKIIAKTLRLEFNRKILSDEDVLRLLRGEVRFEKLEPEPMFRALVKEIRRD